MSLLRRIVPARWKLAYAELRHRLAWRRLPLARPTRRFARREGLEVTGGPFKGLRYPPSAVGVVEQLVPKLLGSYERELHPSLQRVLSGSHQQVVDIGASDGYYAVGLARALPGCPVHAYEMNPLPAKVCRRLAQANGVAERVVVGGECRPEDLRGLPEVPTLVFSDCEGAEAELLDPSSVPLLRISTVVAELHESLAPGVERQVPERFAQTHDLEVVEQQVRHSDDYRALRDAPDLSFVDKDLLVGEFRNGRVRWIVAVPKG